MRRVSRLSHRSSTSVMEVQCSSRDEPIFHRTTNFSHTQFLCCVLSCPLCYADFIHSNAFTFIWLSSTVEYWCARAAESDVCAEIFLRSFFLCVFSYSMIASYHFESNWSFCLLGERVLSMECLTWFDGQSQHICDYDDALDLLTTSPFALCGSHDLPIEALWRVCDEAQWVTAHSFSTFSLVYPRWVFSLACINLFRFSPIKLFDNYKLHFL